MSQVDARPDSPAGPGAQEVAAGLGVAVARGLSEMHDQQWRTRIAIADDLLVTERATTSFLRRRHGSAGAAVTAINVPIPV